MKGHSPKRGTLAAVGTALLGALLILLVNQGKTLHLYDTIDAYCFGGPEFP